MSMLRFDNLAIVCFYSLSENIQFQMKKRVRN